MDPPATLDPVSINEFLDLLGEVTEETDDVTSVTNNTNDHSDSPYRTRCNTWPKRQTGTPTTSVTSSPSEYSPHNNSPAILADNDASLGPLLQQIQSTGHMTVSSNSPLPLVSEEDIPVPLAEAAENEAGLATLAPLSVVRSKSGARRNPWGNLSYADLITQAIQSSPEQRLTLAQIYDWLVKNVAYFHGKGDSISSIGWKVIFYPPGQGPNRRSLFPCKMSVRPSQKQKRPTI